MAAPDTDKPMLYTGQQIQTLMFLDLETTDLPGPGCRPRITELSLVSVHRDNLLMPAVHDEPRVIDKLTVCVCPMKPIQAGASTVTGLYNDTLYYHKDLDEGLVSMLLLYLQRHQGPICIVAHNGNKFDFPLLRAELACVGKSLPDDVLCVDSLLLYKDIDGALPTPACRRVLFADTSSNQARSTSNGSGDISNGATNPQQTPSGLSNVDKQVNSSKKQKTTHRVRRQLQYDVTQPDTADFNGNEVVNIEVRETGSPEGPALMFDPLPSCPYSPKHADTATVGVYSPVSSPETQVIVDSESDSLPTTRRSSTIILPHTPAKPGTSSVSGVTQLSSSESAETVSYSVENSQILNSESENSQILNFESEYSQILNPESALQSTSSQSLKHSLAGNSKSEIPTSKSPPVSPLTLEEFTCSYWELYAGEDEMSDAELLLLTSDSQCSLSDSQLAGIDLGDSQSNVERSNECGSVSKESVGQSNESSSVSHMSKECGVSESSSIPCKGNVVEKVVEGDSVGNSSSCGEVHSVKAVSSSEVFNEVESNIPERNCVGIVNGEHGTSRSVASSVVSEETPEKVPGCTPPEITRLGTHAPRKAPPQAVHRPARLVYKLSVLHRRVLGYDPPRCHRAEDDCMSLLRLFYRTSDLVLPWVDTHAVPFNTMGYMYDPKPRTTLPDKMFPHMS